MSTLRVDNITNEAGAFTQFKGVFSKADKDSVAWTKTGNGTAETSQDLIVEVDDKVVNITPGTSIAKRGTSTKPNSLTGWAND